MLEEKINGLEFGQRNWKENLRKYSVCLMFSTFVGCNSFEYPQLTKETTLNCSAEQTLYCSKPQGYLQNDCTCYDNMPITKQSEIIPNVW